MELQSKQTEIIVAKNDKLLDQIETLKREIEIHKDVEKELAKRSHFCQKVIKRQKLQIGQYEKRMGSTGNINCTSPAGKGMRGMSEKKGGRGMDDTAFD